VAPDQRVGISVPRRRIRAANSATLPLQKN
jgi:hypothetical protein